MSVKNYRPAGVGMFPAQAGTYLLTVYLDGEQPDLVKSNVIGWQVTPGRLLTPLVADPRAADIEPWIVSQPDGRVEASDGRCWDTIELWLADECRPSPQPSQDHITAAPAPIRKPASPPVQAPQPLIPSPVSRSA
jgi:hypothetical protein